MLKDKLFNTIKLRVCLQAFSAEILVSYLQKNVDLSGF
jgi:hypothetical protein